MKKIKIIAPEEEFARKFASKVRDKYNWFKMMDLVENDGKSPRLVLDSLVKSGMKHYCNTERVNGKNHLLYESALRKILIYEYPIFRN